MKENRTKERKRKNKVKRKVSIFTAILWLFLITTMIWVTVNSTKKTNALEVENENWNINLVMYDRSSDTPNETITDFTWNAVNISETKQLCMQINYACTTGKEYQPGEVEITIPGIAMESFSESNRYKSSYESWLKNNITIAADKEEAEHKEYDFSYRYDEESNIYIFTNNNILELNEHFEGTIQIVYNLLPEFKIQTDLEFEAILKENIADVAEIITIKSNVCNFHYTSSKRNYSLSKNAKLGEDSDDYYWVNYYFSYTGTNIGAKDLNIIEAKGIKIKDVFPKECSVWLYDGIIDKFEESLGNEYYLNFPKDRLLVGYPKTLYSKGEEIVNKAELWGRYEDEEEEQKLADASCTVILDEFEFNYEGQLYTINKGAPRFSSKDFYTRKLNI